MNEQDSVKMTPLDQMIAEDQLQILRLRFLMPAPMSSRCCLYLPKSLSIREPFSCFLIHRKFQ